VVSVNPTYLASEIKHILEDSEAVALIVAEKMHRADPLGRIQEIRSELPNLRHVIVDGPGAEPENRLQVLLEKAEVKDEYHRVQPGDLAALIYTSGTTGAPKGSMHSHRTLLFPLTLDTLTRPSLKTLIRMVRRFGFGYFKRTLSVVGKPIKLLYTTPPYAGAGMTVVVNFILSGRTIVIQENFSTTEAIKIIEKEKVNIFGATPALMTLMLRDSEIKTHDLSSIIYMICAAASVSPALVREIKKVVGTPTMIGYGCTEVVGGPTVTDPFTDSEKALQETVGKVTGGYEVKIVDEDRTPVPTHQVGEIALRSGSVMLGYYKAEELTREVIDEAGWYYTGDLGTMDEDGYLRIVGRVKEMIIRAGQNIYPAELESILIKHPKVDAVSVVGIPDDIAGEKVLAFVIPGVGEKLNKIEVMEFCRENLAPYKVPHDVRFMEELPMNPSGKVLKRVLREQVLAEMP
jgi:acyl-CoA synthetase (AMP-forming)/AMP-acid ligase II